MAGMRKEYDPNKAGRRKRRPIIYIICEGKETEIKYFKHFRSRNCLVDIVPISSKHKAAEHLVKHAKGLLSQLDYFPKDGDQLWCVFDCDDNKNTELKNAADYAEKHGYKIAYSNPCFEYWYLLHFVKQNSYLNGAEEEHGRRQHQSRHHLRHQMFHSPLYSERTTRIFCRAYMLVPNSSNINCW